MGVWVGAWVGVWVFCAPHGLAIRISSGATDRGWVPATEAFRMRGRDPTALDLAIRISSGATDQGWVPATEAFRMRDRGPTAFVYSKEVRRATQLIRTDPPRALSGRRVAANCHTRSSNTPFLWMWNRGNGHQRVGKCHSIVNSLPSRSSSMCCRCNWKNGTGLICRYLDTGMKWK